MTDNEIIKALECCGIKGRFVCEEDCPRMNNGIKSVSICERDLKLSALDLINRQKAEIEKLNKENFDLKDGYFQKRYEETDHLELMGLREAWEKARKECDYFQLKAMNLEEDIATAKAKAVKEFAENAIERVEKAKLKYQRLCKEQGEEMEEHMHIHFNGMIGIIGNLLKEKVGDE